MSTYYLGIDVAKLSLEIALEDGKKRLQKQVKNEGAGYAALVKWVEQRVTGREAVQVCLEATGHYGDGVAHYLQQAGYQVSVVNPAHIKAFAKAQGSRQKTDRADAHLIAEYARLFAPRLWQPLAPAILELRTLVRHLASLEKQQQQVRNRAQAGLPSVLVHASLQRTLAFYKAEITACKKQIATFLKAQPTLQAVAALLTSIKGIGALTAARLIAEIGDIHRFDAPQQLVAFFGLDPHHHESGTSVKKASKISRQGNALLRAALYFPAIVAQKHNPIIRAFCLRLKARGKKPKEQVVAAMRKLLHLVYGIWKSGKPFDPHFLDQKA